MNVGGMSNGLPYAIGQSESANRTLLLFAFDTPQGQWLSKLLESAGYRVTTISQLKAVLNLPLAGAHVVVVFNSRPHWRTDLVYEICSSLKHAAPKLPWSWWGRMTWTPKLGYSKSEPMTVVEPFDQDQLLIRRQRPGPP